MVKKELGRMDEIPFEDFLNNIDGLSGELVASHDYRNPETGYISPESWNRLVKNGVLSPLFMERKPEKRQAEIMELARILSFHDLHLGLTYGIVGALGVITLQRFSHSEEQGEEFLSLVREGHLIGLAITELNKSGSTALDMDSNYSLSKDGEWATVTFAKHLQGLSGNKGMIVALNKDGAERKTIGLFFVPQELIDTRLTEMAGLHGIAYGVNTGYLELEIEKYLLTEIPRERLDEFQDIFIKSRFFFIGMTLGHQEKMEAMANRYADERMIEGKPQAEILVVKRALGRIRAGRIVTEGVFNHVINFRDSNGDSIHSGDTRALSMQANIVKVIGTEYALDAAQMRAELKGGSGFYEGDALQDYVDIWPFQIFEGSRLMLNAQIGRSFLAPLRHDGKVVMKGFSDRDSYDNFLDYFMKTANYRALFDGKQTIENLDGQTTQLLISIMPKNLANDEKEVVGRIICRLFALGCLNENSYLPDDFNLAKQRLNLEISQQILELLP